MRRTVLLIALLVVSGCEAPDDPPTFAPAVSVGYDTVTIVGGEEERNPLFLYARLAPYLLDSVSVAYADEGRLVVANLLTGKGWEARSSRGDEGPGEFGGREVILSPFGGLVHAVGRNWNFATWTLDGRLVASGRIRPPYAQGREFAWLQGIVDGRLVMLYRGVAMRTTAGVDTLPQGIRIHDLRDGRVVDVREGIPDLVERVTSESESSTRFETLSGEGVIVVARGRTIARGTSGGRGIVLLDSSGRIVASRELDAGLRYLWIDADGRIWAHVLPEGSIVFSSDLSEELFRVAATGVRDASGAYMLAVGEGRLQTPTMVLLRMRFREP